MLFCSPPSQIRHAQKGAIGGGHTSCAFLGANHSHGRESRSTFGVLYCSHTLGTVVLPARNVPER